MDAGLKIYDKLLQFTLFQGMSHADLMEVVGHTKFGFSKHPEGQRIVKDDDVCDHLIFLTAGTLSVETVSDNRTCRVSETVNAPYAIQVEQLFGLTQRYTSTFRTLTECSFITIDKDELLRLSEGFLVFRLNLLNLYATQAQKLLRQPWRHRPESLSDRIVRFLVHHCVYPAGPKTFHILMTQLAAEVGDSRLDVSRVLNQLQRDGLLHLHRGRIEVPQMERLIG